MVPLFTDLSAEDSASIIKDLERQAIAYQLKNDGAIVMVPKDNVARLRMKLAESGLPKGGGVGYEIFDKSDALGTTSFVQNINHLRALEGELARTTAEFRVARTIQQKLFPRGTPDIAGMDIGAGTFGLIMLGVVEWSLCYAFVLAGDGELRPMELRPLDEQTHRFVWQESFRRGVALRVGHREGWHAIGQLSGHPEPLAAARQQDDLRTLPQHRVGQPRARGE